MAPRNSGVRADIDYTVVEINQYTGHQQYTASPLSSRTAVCGFQCYKYGVFLGRTWDKKYWRTYWPGQTVDYYCQ